MASVIAAALLAGCAGPVPVDPPTQPGSATSDEFFTAPGGPFRTLVPPDAPADPRSADYVARLNGLNLVVSVGQFAVPVFLVDANTPRYRITPTASYATPESTLKSVPIPDRAGPDPGDDGHMVVLDNASRCVYEFYRARRDVTGWTAEWVNAIPSDGDGVYPDGLSTRAGGFSAVAGLIWPEELRAKRIDHALLFGYPFTQKDMIAGDATRTDGRTIDPGALPVGAHLVLDPSLDIDSLGLPEPQKTIAKTLQEYGMVLADTSGGFTLYAVHPRSFAADPYPEAIGGAAWASLTGIPFNRMKVLLIEPKARYTGPPIPNRCTEAAR